MEESRLVVSNAPSFGRVWPIILMNERGKSLKKYRTAYFRTAPRRILKATRSAFLNSKAPDDRFVLRVSIMWLALTAMYNL